MIASLEDAWRWYESARSLTRAMQRLGKKHWDTLPWEGELGRDERLRHLDKVDVLDQSQAVLADLDDLCVLLLFSVFEAIVRARVLEDVERELPETHHAVLRHAVATMRDAIEHGSFYRVLEPYREADPDLCEEVSQVRRYRNWVAHGRRDVPPEAVEPLVAYNRLQRFLDRFAPPAGSAPA
jgi:hypothetical protein